MAGIRKRCLVQAMFPLALTIGGFAASGSVSEAAAAQTEAGEAECDRAVRSGLTAAEVDLAIRGCSAMLQRTDLGDEMRTVVHAFRAIAYEKAGKLDLASHDVDWALQRNPSFGLAAYFRAKLYEVGGRLEDAAAAYARAATLPGGYAAKSHNGYCWVMAAKLSRSLDEAKKHCDSAIAIAPNQPEFHDSRGLVHIRLGDFDKAWSDYNMAVQLDSTRAHYWYGRGIANLRRGQKESGQADLAKARALDAKVVESYEVLGIRP